MMGFSEMTLGVSSLTDDEVLLMLIFKLMLGGNVLCPHYVSFFLIFL